MNTQCVDVGFHQGAEGVIDHPVSRQGSFSGERIGHDCYVKMATPIASTGTNHGRLPNR